jgi:hypothetical protein
MRNLWINWKGGLTTVEFPPGVFSMVSDRLSQLERNLKVLYAQLGAAEEGAIGSISKVDKLKYEQEIENAIQPQIRKYERQYWQQWQIDASGLAIPEDEAKVVTAEILQGVQFLELEPTVQNNTEMLTLLREIKVELTKPGSPAAGKLKAAIPLLPGFISYEMELDTEGLLRRTFPTFCKLANKLKK